MPPQEMVPEIRPVSEKLSRYSTKFRVRQF